jgi:hypothetical protein
MAGGETSREARDEVDVRRAFDGNMIAIARKSWRA